VPYCAATSACVFQDFKLLPNRTVYDNVAYALQVIGEQPREIRRKVPDILRLSASRPSCTTTRPALRRRAAARLDRARVRQPPAAAARRRADRQPRPRDLDRDHAAALPDQPHRHDVVVATHDREMVDKMRRRVIELRDERMLTGLLGAVGALLLLAIVYVALNGYDRGLTDPARLVGVPLLVAMLAAFGLLLGAFGSGITLRRFLRV
jgi:hypothetical protein